MTYRSCQNVLVIGSFLLLISAALPSRLTDRWAPAYRFPQMSAPTVAAATVVTVWTNQKTGLYYCADSKLYGNVKPGAYMTQEQAQERGYQPSGGVSCR